MIVKNEELILEKSLESIKSIADEIIITDTGSTDKTVEIAKKFTNKIYHFKWDNNFAAAYDFSRKHASFSYACRWDADFLLRGNSVNDLLSLKKRNFDNSDIISFTWNIAFGDNNSPINSIHRWFIYKKDKFHFESEVHADIAPNKPKESIIKNSYPYIEIDHLKDKEKKAYRYRQTLLIVKNILKKDPFNKRILFAYAEELLFEKEFSKAIEIFLKFLEYEKIDTEKRIVALENLLLCFLSLRKKNELKTLFNKYYGDYSNSPRFLLAYADMTALFDIKKAEIFYLRYLLNPVNPNDTIYLFDYERHLIHPHFALGQIYFQLNNLSESIKHLNYVLENTRLNKRRLSAMMLVDKIQHLKNEI
jgi:glycosyltransferase involved in cell wall biosynthesis